MPPGSLIAVKPVAFDEVRVGDVVTYQIRSGDPAVVTHRVVGTTSSTGGDRLLITRGDANDLDDPPGPTGTAPRLRRPRDPVPRVPGGTVRGAGPRCGDRVGGVLIVGYGGALLILDLARSSRSRRRRRTTFGLVVVLVAGIAASVGSPAPAEAPTARRTRGCCSASTGRRSPPTVPCRCSAPMRRSSGRVRHVGPVDPQREHGCRARGDPHRCGPRGEASTDRELAEDLRLVVDDAAVDPGGEWVSDPIAPGATLRVDVALRLDPGAPNASRRGEALVTPSVRLTQAVGEGVSGRDPDGVLPLTGAAAAPSAALLVAALLASGAGSAFSVAGRGKVRIACSPGI